MWAQITAVTWSRGNGTSPQKSSNATHASEYWSARPSTGLPAICSGAE